MASKSIDNAFTAKTLRGAATDPTYAGVLSFMRRKYSKNLTDVDAVVLGSPFDAAVSNRPGARFGSPAISSSRWPSSTMATCCSTTAITSTPLP